MQYAPATMRYPQRTMIIRTGDTPWRDRIWQNAVLTTILDAVTGARFELMSFSCGWNGNVFVSHSGTGTRITLVFGDYDVVGTATYDKSSRAPWRSPFYYPPGAYYTSIRDHLRPLIQRALQYHLEDLNGQERPVITAALWSDGTNLCAEEPWSAVEAHSEQRFNDLLLDPEDAMANHVENYELESGQQALIWSLFSRRITLGATLITLTPEEVTALGALGPEQLAVARDMLAQVNIVVPFEPPLSNLPHQIA